MEERVRHERFRTLKKKYAKVLLLFKDEVGYYAYDEDADVLNQTVDCPLLNWDGIKAAGFPIQALDIMLPKLVIAGYRVGVCDNLKEESKRCAPLQLELFTF